MRSISSVLWFVGTCGIWDSDWLDNFYPKGLRSVDWLEYYATHFPAIEMNTTFHRIPKPQDVRRWANVTPYNFRFCVKFPKIVTHEFPHCLSRADTMDNIKQFFDVIQELGQKLEIVLMQFPGDLSAEHRPMLLDFLDRISCPARLVLEFRNNTWWTRAMAGHLRSRDIGWATADRGRFPEVAAVPPGGYLRPFGLRRIISTSDFLYVRWLGQHHQFPKHIRERFDSTPRLTWWYERLRDVLKAYPNVRQVYSFFDNDFSGHAPFAAQRFARVINSLGAQVMPNQDCWHK